MNAQYDSQAAAADEKPKRSTNTVPFLEVKGTANTGSISFIPLRIPDNGLNVDRPKEKQLWEYIKVLKYRQIWVPYPMNILPEAMYAVKGAMQPSDTSLIKEVSNKLAKVGFHERQVYFTAYRGKAPKDPKKMSEREKHITDGLSAYFSAKNYSDTSGLDEVQKNVLGSLFKFQSGNIMTNYLSAEEDAIMMYGYLTDADAKDFVPYKGQIVCLVFKNQKDKEQNQAFWTAWQEGMNDAKKDYEAGNKEFLDDILCSSFTNRKYYVNVKLKYSNNMIGYTVSIKNTTAQTENIPEDAAEKYNQTNWIADVTKCDDIYDRKSFENALKRANERLAYYEPEAVLPQNADERRAYLEDAVRPQGNVNNNPAQQPASAPSQPNAQASPAPSATQKDDDLPF